MYSKGSRGWLKFIQNSQNMNLIPNMSLDKGDQKEQQF